MVDASGRIRKIRADRHSTMLILGKAATNHSLKEVSYETDYASVLKKYGKSDLSEAFRTAREFGADYIFLMNLRNSSDYSVLRDIIPQTDFTYIVPVSVYMSDFYNEDIRDGGVIPYISQLVALTGKNHGESVVVATDIHAKLYGDEDSFIEAQSRAESFVTGALNSACNRENLVFVANNLEGFENANVVLAAALCSSDVSEYPMMNFKRALLNLDTTDVKGSWGFFKNHVSGETSYENFLNYLPTGNPKKIGTVSRISKMIKREMDFSEFTGKLYSEYRRLCIYRKLEKYLGKLKDYVITDYRIRNVTPFKDKNLPSVTIRASVDVLPKGCLEMVHIDIDIGVMQ